MSEDLPQRERWARLRFAIVGPLLAAPPPRGELRQALERLAEKTWRHPTTGEPMRFSADTLERWFYTARNARRDPVGELRRVVRKDAGTQPSLTTPLRQALRAQYQAHRSWSVQLHYDNLVALAETEPALAPLPSYATVRRYMRVQGMAKQPRRRARSTPGAIAAAQRHERLEVRSFEAEYTNALWHSDYHHGSRPVLTRAGQWQTPLLLGILDDHSRLACHLQWYLEENAETFVHGLCQAFQKRALPRALMTDNGAPMMASEVRQGLHELSVVHQTTLPYSPYQNAKQEVFWAQVEGRLISMLEGLEELTLELLNEATQAWVELEYNRKTHSELGCSPIERYLQSTDVGRDSPAAPALRRAFRAELTRTQRKSDGTCTVFGRRFEIPSRYRHLDKLHLRVARWDLAHLDLLDPRTGTLVCALYPLNKSANAEANRRTLEPLNETPPAPTATDIAPLLRHLMTEYAATGLPPAYLPLHTREEDPEAPAP